MAKDQKPKLRNQKSEWLELLREAAETVRFRVFCPAEVATILKIPVSRVRSWTIGRPLRITPSIPAHGTGKPNFYGIADVLAFAFANALWKGGLTTKVISPIVSDGAFDNEAKLLFQYALGGGQSPRWFIRTCSITDGGMPNWKREHTFSPELPELKPPIISIYSFDLVPLARHTIAAAGLVVRAVEASR
jgi:hypothetical protein